MTYRPNDEERSALASYAAEHGRCWKQHLELDWYHARAIGERGSILHSLRNHPQFGPYGLRMYRVAKVTAS